MKSELKNLQVPLNEESPLAQHYDAFDIENIEWSENDYKLNAMQVPIEETNKLLVQDFHWRKDHGQNIVASIEGKQGSGKSMPFSYLGLLLGTIFGYPFKPTDIYYSPEELDYAISHAEPCQTFFRDEHRKANVGMMSNMINENLADYEDQLRINQNNLLFAAVELQKHSHFFCFEAKHIVFDENAYPQKFISVLKTPRYTNRKEFVWRGYVSFPMPNEKFVEEYLKRKNEHILNLQKKYGNTLNPVLYYAKQIFNKRKNDLIRRTKDGFVIPMKRELMDFIVAEEIGTRKFTVPGYDRLTAQIRDLITKEYESENQEISISIEQKKELDRQKREQEREAELELIEERRKQKQEFMREKLEEEKRKNNLKERSIRLKEEVLKQVAELKGKEKKKRLKNLSKVN